MNLFDLDADDQISCANQIFFHLLQKNMNTLSEFSACFLTDLHCRKSFLVPGTMLVNMTVEINRHEQCDSHEPAFTTKTFLI